MSKARFLLSIMLGLLFVVACTSNPVSPPPTSPESQSDTQTESNTSSEFIDICEPLDLPGIAFPRQEYVEGSRAVMEAELVGTLVRKDGCLQIDSIYGDGTVIPIWPAEFTLATEENTLIVLDEAGNPLVREGEEIYMGGGEGSATGMLDCVRQQLPAACNGKFWYVGEGVRPNLRFDSELFSLSLITSTQRTAILLQKKPILDEWKEAPTTITGELVLYTPMRCPRIRSESGISDFMPIWPPDYSLEFKDGKVEIINASGEVLVSEGQQITLTGGLIPHSWDADEYRDLYYELPGDCHAPYWIVGE